MPQVNIKEQSLFCWFFEATNIMTVFNFMYLMTFLVSMK